MSSEIFNNDDISQDVKNTLKLLKTKWDTLKYNDRELNFINSYEIWATITDAIDETSNLHGMHDEWNGYMQLGLAYVDTIDEFTVRMNAFFKVCKKIDDIYFYGNSICVCGNDYDYNTICCINCTEYYCSECYVRSFRKNNGMTKCPHCNVLNGSTLTDITFKNALDNLKKKYNVMDRYKCICGNDGHLLCSKCTQMRYCSKICQKNDWKKHDITCNRSHKQLKKKIKNYYKEYDMFLHIDGDILTININKLCAIVVNVNDSFYNITQIIKPRHDLLAYKKFCKCGVRIFIGPVINCPKCHKTDCHNCTIDNLKKTNKIICSYCQFVSYEFVDDHEINKYVENLKKSKDYVGDMLCE